MSRLSGQRSGRRRAAQRTPLELLAHMEGLGSSDLWRSSFDRLRCSIAENDRQRKLHNGCWRFRRPSSAADKSWTAVGPDDHVVLTAIDCCDRISSPRRTDSRPAAFLGEPDLFDVRLPLVAEVECRRSLLFPNRRVWCHEAISDPRTGRQTSDQNGAEQGCAHRSSNCSRGAGLLRRQSSDPNPRRVGADPFSVHHINILHMTVSGVTERR